MTAKALVGTPDREPRCRMRNALGDPCPSPALDPDPKAVQICMKHAGKVIQLVAEHRARRLGRTS